jgi:hypothetical protein
MALTTLEVLNVRRTVLPNAAQRTKGAAMTIAPEHGGTSVKIPFAPVKVDHENLGAEYAVVSRPGLDDFYVYSRKMRPTMSMTLTVADKRVVASNGNSTVTTAIAVIKVLQGYARKAAKVRVAYGTFESGLWVILGMSMSSEIRNPISDEITSAKVTLDFARAETGLYGAGTGSGPVTGGAATKPGTPTPTTPTKTVLPYTPSAVSKAASSPSARYYVTKSGDSLTAISLKFYGVTTKWRAIADANGIKDPRKLPPSKRLRIP